MFRKVDTIRFKHTVTIRMPSASAADQSTEETFIGLFRALPQSESSALAAEMAAAVGLDEIAAAERHQISSVLEGWEDVVDESGAPLAFGPDVLTAFCEWSWFREGVARAYLDGIAGARLGN